MKREEMKNDTISCKPMTTDDKLDMLLMGLCGRRSKTGTQKNVRMSSRDD